MKYGLLYKSSDIFAELDKYEITEAFAVLNIVKTMLEDKAHKEMEKSMTSAFEGIKEGLSEK